MGNVRTGSLSKLSAGVLLLGGATLLFASDTVLPRLTAGAEPVASWPGELVGAGWLALAALNWLSRGAVLGGIYGRPVVTANATLFLVTALVLVRVAADGSGPAILWIPGCVALLLAGAYGWLLLRGPLD